VNVTELEWVILNYNLTLLKKDILLMVDLVNQSPEKTIPLNLILVDLNIPRPIQ
jgi:hypothetical protein